MAKYEKYDESEGVWRTVGGRRIFIRDGQSLSDAMKKSGKFKSAKKKVDYDKRPQSDVDKENERNNKAVEKIEKGKKDFDPNDFEKWRKEVDPDYEMDDDRARLRYEAYKDANVRNQSAKQKEGVRTLSGDLERDNKGRIVSQDEYDEFRKAYKEDRISKEDYRNNNYDALKKSNQSNVKSQQSDIEKASGLKVEKAWNTDLYGNGKEDRFKLDDGRWISHTTESFGSKDDTWSINKLENGSIESQDFKSYDDMIKHLGGSNKSETITRTVKEIDADYYGVPSRYRTEKMTNEWNKSRNNAYKKAFEEYKKRHPNSKLNLQKFIDMSEGK